MSITLKGRKRRRCNRQRRGGGEGGDVGDSAGIPLVVAGEAWMEGVFV